MALAIRITLPKESVNNICTIWIRHCDQIIAYEHNEANRVHCHILMINPHVTTQRLKQLSLREERGNTFWSFKTGTGDIGRYITYMSKGKLQPCYLRTNDAIPDEAFEKTFTDQQIYEFKEQWTQPLPQVPKQYKEYVEFEVWIKANVAPDQRANKENVKYYAKDFCFRKHMMFHQQCNNQIANYTATYCHRNHIHA